AGFGHRSRHRRGPVLVVSRRAGPGRDVTLSLLVALPICAAAGAAAVLVGDGDGDRVGGGSAQAGVVEVLVAGAVAENAGGEIQRAVERAVAPPDDDRVRGQGAGVGEAAAYGRRAVLVDDR